jgi:hypothetical protein
MEYTNRRNANEYGLFALMGVVHPTDSVVKRPCRSGMAFGCRAAAGVFFFEPPPWKGNPTALQPGGPLLVSTGGSVSVSANGQRFEKVCQQLDEAINLRGIHWYLLGTLAACVITLLVGHYVWR